MHRAWLVVLLATGVVCPMACAPGSPEPEAADALLNGGIPAQTLYPAVGLVSSRYGEFFCTGTLVAPDLVLTAAHCVIGPLITSFYTGAGEPVTDLTSTPTNLVRHAVNGWAELPGYAGPARCPAHGDIGLVHLAEPITDITPMRFGRAASALSSRRCEAVGYGTHRGPEGITYKQKRWGFMNLLEIRDDAVRAGQGDTPSVGRDGGAIVLPAGDDPNGYNDRGDSGGPILCDDAVFAVTSCGPSGAIDGWNTMTEPHADWIAAANQQWPSILFQPLSQ